MDIDYGNASVSEHSIFRHNEFTDLLTINHQTKSIALVTAVNAIVYYQLSISSCNHTGIKLSTQPP